MDILDRDLKDVDLQKQDAYRLMVTYNKSTGEKFFDWVVVLPEKNVMLHESLRRLRAKQLGEQKDNLKDFLPPLIVAVDKFSGEKSLHFASDRDMTEENVKKIDDTKSYIWAEFSKFSIRFLERGKTSSFDDVASYEEQQAALWDSIPDEELFKTPKNAQEARLQKELIEMRMASVKKQDPLFNTYRFYAHEGD